MVCPDGPTTPVFPVVVELSVRSRPRPDLSPEVTGVGIEAIGVEREITSRDVVAPFAPLPVVTMLEATGCDAVASCRPRTASKGTTLAAPAATAALLLGASVTCPEVVVAARTVVIVCGRPRSATDIFAASTGLIGAPLFSLITAILAWKVGGAGGGATRATTERDITAAGGLVAAGRSARDATRRAPAVGTTGSAPRTTGAATT